MANLKDITSVSVFKGSIRVATLERVTNGSRLTYDADYFEKHADDPHSAISAQLPVQQRVHETHGVNLAPYFAGLLPEGLRMQALQKAVKTSKDDLFTFLLAIGYDAVGDISISIDNEPVVTSKTSKLTLKSDKISFAELFKESISLERLVTQANEPVVPGVHEKLSAGMISFPVRVKERGKEYILKLSSKDKEKIVENEHFFMSMARAFGFSTAKTEIVRDRDNVSGLLVERFDRVYQKEEKKTERLYQEDACQFLGRYPQDKYRLSFSEIADGLQECCSAPIVDIANLIKLKAFSYLIGNGDLHAKNISVRRKYGERRTELSPVYDVLSTLPYGDQRMALQIEGRDSNISRNHFISFAERYGVRAVVVESFLDQLIEESPGWIARLGEIGLSAKKTKQLSQFIEARRAHLEGR